VSRRRDHGGIIFIDLRDRSGFVQVVLNPENLSGYDYATAERLRSEWCVQVTGTVQKRPEGSENPALPTGDIEDTADRPGYLQIREKPLAENVAAALGMMRLSHVTFEERYLHTAHHTLSAYVEANRDYGELAADYAIAVDRYLNPVVEVTVEGRPGTHDADAMLAAAMELDTPNLLIKLATADNATLTWRIAPTCPCRVRGRRVILSDLDATSSPI